MVGVDACAGLPASRKMQTEIAAVAFCVVLGGLAVFQLALAMGAPLGRFAWGGAHERLPVGLRVGSLVAVFIYALFAVIVLERAGLIALFPHRSIAGIGTWVIVGYLALGVAGNALSRSRPERFTMTPLALTLCALAFTVALAQASS
jgi:hypothetical protein